MGVCSSCDCCCHGTGQSDAVIRAIVENDPQALAALISADPLLVNAVGREGLSPLHAAVVSNNEPCVRLLLDSGLADLKALSSTGREPLHNACARSTPEIVKLLLDAGADINAVAPSTSGDGHERGMKPLDFAVEWGKGDTAALLRARGAELSNA